MKPERKKGEEKLYRQWVKHGDLLPEAIPPKESPSKESREEVPLSKARIRDVGRERVERGFPILYMVLGVAIFVLGIGLGLLLSQSC